MNKLCILCQQSPPIKNSHIVPNFAVRRLKKGNPIGTLIHSDKINKVEQDGWKKDYLCLQCEERFSKLEDWFCKTVYDPFIETQISSFDYDGKLSEFSVSLYFRYLKFLIDHNSPKEDCAVLLPLLEHFRNRLNSSDYSGLFSYLAFHRPVDSLAEGYVPGINTYFYECIDGRMFEWHFTNSDKYWIMYVKMPFLYFVWAEADLQRLFVKSVDVLEVTGLQIAAVGAYQILPQNACLDRLLKDDFNRKATEIQDGYLVMNEKRSNGIKERIRTSSNRSDYRAEHSYQLDMALLNKTTP